MNIQHRTIMPPLIREYRRSYFVEEVQKKRPIKRVLDRQNLRRARSLTNRRR